jgi:poly-beta-1,6-N-acetyl-D-glucosamine synthase
MKFVIITPVRNEEKYLEQTVKSVISQTVKPIEWVIVNDGSSDRTGIIIDSYSKQFQWIRPVHRKNRGYRKSGGGVIEAFYDGYNSLVARNWDYVVKLDGDLTFDKQYFEKCFKKFDKIQNLGICGGGIYHVADGHMHLEENPSFHVRGATKIYKRKCWDAIGGLPKHPGWDTVDEVKARMLGWDTRTFPEIKVIHHRRTGGADGIWRGAIKDGNADYFSGYHPLFMFAKYIRRVFKKPYLVESLGLFYGFLRGYIRRGPQVDDAELVRYLRKQQLRRLFFMDSMWR